MKNDQWTKMDELCSPFAIMSIKPDYAYLVLSGKKRWEFRKRSMRRLLGKRILLYATAPRQQIVGEIMIKAEIYGNASQVWDITGPQSGILWYQFNDYFTNSSKPFYVHAGLIADYHSIEGPTLESIRAEYASNNWGKWNPPQSWTMLAGTETECKWWGLG